MAKAEEVDLAARQAILERKAATLATLATLGRDPETEDSQRRALFR